MKKKYDLHQQFFVVFAINERSETFETFKLGTIQNKTLGLHDTIENAPNNELSDGEVAEALSSSLESIFGDNYKYRLISLVNWYAI